jgi:hypothetical protein
MRICLIPVILLAACASPAPQFFGAARSEVTLGGIRFAVFAKDNQAEVVRMGYLSRAARAPVQGLMMQAAEQATGCRVRASSFATQIPGDAGEARMSLDC